MPSTPYVCAWMPNSAWNNGCVSPLALTGSAGRRDERVVVAGVM